MASIEENRLAVKSGDIFHATSFPASCPAAPTFREARQFVKDWLWDGQDRKTEDMPWSDKYVDDATRMIQSFIKSMKR